MPCKVIDVHCHMFSALCLPIEGILRELVDEDDGYCIMKPAKRQLARNLAQVLTLLAQSAQTWDCLLDENWPAEVDAARSLDKIAKLLKDLLVRESKRRRTATLKLVSVADDEIVSVIGELLDLTGHGKVFSALRAAHAPGLPAVNLLKGKLFEQTVGHAIKTLLERLFGKAENVLQQLRFLLMLLLPEKRIAESLVNAYAGVGALATVEHFVPLMMDMEPAYERYHGAPPVFDYVERQIPLMREVMQAHPNRLLGFVAFDPRRSRLPDGTVDPARPLEIVKQGLAACNIGVKYYPSMGYNPTKEGYEEEHRLLFEYCAKENVPILTHCQWGVFKADNDWDKNTDPDNWREALSTHKGLRVCFGHAGGGIYKPKNGDITWGWFGTEEKWKLDNCLGRKVVEVCAKYDGAYCDLSIFSEFMDGYDTRPDKAGGRLEPDQAIAIFQDRLERLIVEKPVLAKKIMYGSDWHMPSMLGRTSEYLQIMLRMFGTGGLEAHADDFFYNNAATRFLRLSWAQPVASVPGKRGANRRPRASDVRQPPAAPIHWDGDVILQDTVVPGKRFVIGTPDKQVETDIREWFAFADNNVMKTVLKGLESMKKLPKTRNPGDFDRRARIIWDYVCREVEYVHDLAKQRKEDFWLFPPEVLTLKKGDCEDSSFLLASLLLASGISPFCVRVVLGETRDEHGVSLGGHCWPMYKDESGVWRILESTLDAAPARMPEADHAAAPGQFFQYVPEYCLNNYHLWGIFDAAGSGVPAQRLIAYLRGRRQHMVNVRTTRLPAGGWLSRITGDWEPGHWDFTRAALLKCGFTEDATDIAADASQDPDFYDWFTPCAHAQTKSSPDGLASENRAQAYAAFIDWIVQWTTKMKAGAEKAPRSALFMLGYILHGIQDLATHRGITNPQHSYLSSLPGQKDDPDYIEGNRRLALDFTRDYLMQFQARSPSLFKTLAAYESDWLEPNRLSRAEKRDILGKDGWELSFATFMEYRNEADLYMKVMAQNPIESTRWEPDMVFQALTKRVDAAG